MIPTIADFTGQTVIVQLGPDSYPIYVGSNCLDRLADAFLRHCGCRRAVIITDDNVNKYYGSSVKDLLIAGGIEANIISIPPGEGSKYLPTLQSVYDQLFDFSVERSDAIVALGGGVVGDLAGFAAACFKRGIKYVQVPTTLLAMVDSSIGGKTAVNHPRGKNMIGAFYQPKLVFADIAVLKTLPRRELGCGLAETVKHAIIRDGLFFEFLEKHAGQIIALRQDLLVELVVRNCNIKAEVVSADERESGLRRILNLGHSIGHALETVFSGGDYHHGEAVSLGMVAAARLAVGRKLLKESLLPRIVNLLQAFDLPTGIRGDIPVNDLYTAMLHDKKVEAGRLNFVLPTALGNCTIVSDLTETQIKTAIASLAKTENP